MTLQPFEITLSLAALLLIIELLTGTFSVICLSPALLIVGLVEFIFHDFSLVRDFLVFVIVAALSSLAVRLIFKKPGDSKNVTSDINDY